MDGGTTPFAALMDVPPSAPRQSILSGKNLAMVVANPPGLYSIL
jgi:hypothetical protein